MNELAETSPYRTGTSDNFYRVPPKPRMREKDFKSIFGKAAEAAAWMIQMLETQG